MLVLVLVLVMKGEGAVVEKVRAEGGAEKTLWVEEGEDEAGVEECVAG